VQSSAPPIQLDGLCESGKANLEISKVKCSVVVGHESNPHDPVWETRSRPDATNASVRALIDWTEVEGLCHGEGLASEVEVNFREIRIARESIESIGFKLRIRDLLIDCSNTGGITDDKASSL
jgi:hypothetical protein